VLTDSDHLQTQAALAADHFGLPGKDWRVGPRTKNKAEMRRHFAAAGVDGVRSAELAPGRGPSELLAADLPCPRVTTPCEGVRPAGSHEELVALTKEIGQRRPDAAMVDEEVLTGEQCDLLLAPVLSTSLFELWQRTYLGEPLRAVGAAHPHHHTNRDCVLRTCGTDENAVDQAAEAFFASGRRGIA
jgi:hypothetical protein